jgi:hypothetical protein
VGSRLHAGFGMSLQRVTASTRAKLSDDAARHGAPGGGEELHQLRLQYTSTLLAADADEGWRTLGTILESAVPNNSRLRIGGLLTFNPSTVGVTQMLEGPAPAVRALALPARGSRGAGSHAAQARTWQRGARGRGAHAAEGRACVGAEQCRSV